jgi:phosphate starvation-inducible PhoH-like protein
LNHAFVILDEAQNTTPEQMKMFLTRIGFGSKAVVTGDVSQVDLPRTQLSGLVDAERVLKRVNGIAITRLTSADVVRHPLVARIVDAYDRTPGGVDKTPRGANKRPSAVDELTIAINTVATSPSKARTRSRNGS